MKLKDLLTIALVLAPVASISAQLTAHLDMSLTNGQITEGVTDQSFNINSQLPACSIKGIDGEALRFDGYSNYAKVALPVNTFSTETLTASVLLAAESYPMMQVDAAESTPTYATIFGNLDATAKKGFALQLSSQGDLRLQLYVNYGGGYLVTVDGSEKLPRGRWNNVTMTFDKTGNAITLYLNGNSIGSKKSNRCGLQHGSAEFVIGKDDTSVLDPWTRRMYLNAFCGAIDDITVTNAVNVPDAFAPEAAPDFNYPAERYASSLWRPLFHGMPSGSWTNESHGMIYANGRYHVFFQKNANGPYMSRLHWGHISSRNLYEWTEEPIAIYPGETFDIKGCWSGCVYKDGADTYILYTAVDNAKARIVQAKAMDEDLMGWGEKRIIIDGRPNGLSDDFRDPFYFQANGRQYVIVGTSKNGIGACTLHQLRNGTWTNDGSIFFQGSSTAQHGTFWEMPNVTDMGNGQYLFTCTPLGTGNGVRTLCWVGTIDSDGKFTPTGNMQYLELNGISRDGYGLLSPTVFRMDGKTLLMGIVPDKLATEENRLMGWAHNFSLPREILTDNNGLLVQKPYSGLTDLRTDTRTEKMLSNAGTFPLLPVSGRQIELLGEFTVGNTGQCGFSFLKSGNNQATLTYDMPTGQLTLNTTSLSRIATDDGTWSVPLPVKLAPQQTLKLHLFLDGSIADIFVNDRWAFSTRIFPTEAGQADAEVFTTADIRASVKAWVLDASQDPDRIREIHTRGMRSTIQDNMVYDLCGRSICGSRQKGIRIINGKKYAGR